MTRSCRPSSPALAPVLLALLLGGEWGPCPSVPLPRPIGLRGVSTHTSQSNVPHRSDGETEVGRAGLRWLLRRKQRGA